MDTIQLPVLEDRSAILIALSKVLNGLASGRLDPRRVGLFLYGLQIATQIVDRKSDIVPSRTVDSVTQTDTGEELGPEKQMCNDENCPDCPERDTCEFCNLEEEDDEGNEEEVKAQPHPRTLTAAQHLLLAVNRILPTVHGTASTAHRPLLHLFTALMNSPLTTDNCPLSQRHPVHQEICGPPSKGSKQVT
jgi:hypothetical protein